MALTISSELLRQIVAEAAASPAVEVCGLLLGTAGSGETTPKGPPPLARVFSKGVPQAMRSGQVLRQAQHERGEGAANLAGGTVEEVRPCRNVAADPGRRFEIDPAALLAAHRQARAGGAAILGCYHSHPSGRAEPSACDAAAAEPNGWWWLIVAGEEMRGWRAVEAGEWHGRFEEATLVA